MYKNPYGVPCFYLVNHRVVSFCSFLTTQLVTRPGDSMVSVSDS